jgi:hypothetical protein
MPSLASGAHTVRRVGSQTELLLTLASRLSTANPPSQLLFRIFSI